MKRTLTMALATFAVVAFVPAALADNDPFPSTTAPAVFVSAQTVTTTRVISSSFAPSSTVIFRAYAIDAKTHKKIVKGGAKYFYVTIPNQPNVKLKYGPKAAGANGVYAWTGAWKVPDTYPAGIVHFKVLIKTQANRIGQFVQMPVATASLTITPTPQAPPPPGNAPAAAAEAGSTDIGLYVDSVNGTRPVGVPPRPVGCTQTNVFRRGEQVVIRAWGYDLTSGALLTNDNVTEAHFTVAGVPNVTLNWGTHGTAGSKVYFWSNAWIIPAGYPLGTAIIKVTFTLTSGKHGTFDYPITINP
jgi:hypothetical protein